MRVRKKLILKKKRERAHTISIDKQRNIEGEREGEKERNGETEREREIERERESLLRISWRGNMVWHERKKEVDP